MYKKYRVYYYVVRVDGKQKWIRLSDDYQEALYKYAELEGNPQNTGLVKDAIDRYQAEILPSKAAKTIRVFKEYLFINDSSFNFSTELLRNNKIPFTVQTEL